MIIQIDNCGYCPNCYEERAFCQLPKHYFERVYIASSEWAMQTSRHLSVHSGAISSLCIGSCLTSVQEAEAVWAEQERAEIAKDLLG